MQRGGAAPLFSCRLPNVTAPRCTRLPLPAGGPFQTRKRRAVPWLLYVEIALWLLLLGFTSKRVP